MNVGALIHPEMCCGCRRPARGALCHGCLLTVRRIEPVCQRCESHMAGSADGCHECRGGSFDQAVQAFHFDELIRKAIHRLKYRGELGIATTLTRAAVDRAWHRLAEEPQAIGWVPSSDSRTRDRGFDHAALIAASISQITGVPCFEALRKIRETPQQVKLEPEQRREVIRGAIRARLPSPPKILIVDDVFTTGTSVSESSRALKAAGAEWVGAFCIARSSGRSPARQAYSR